MLAEHGLLLAQGEEGVAVRTWLCWASHWREYKRIRVREVLFRLLQDRLLYVVGEVVGKKGSGREERCEW